jgi:hypothetical protein
VAKLLFIQYTGIRKKERRLCRWFKIYQKFGDSQGSATYRTQKKPQQVENERFMQTNGYPHSPKQTPERNL